MSFKRVRITILLGLLLLIATLSILQTRQLDDWSKTLPITIYPINAKGSSEVSAYIDQLDAGDFAAITDFMSQESQRYGQSLTPIISAELGPRIHSMPPTPPADRNSKLAVMWWSLKLRWWMWRSISSFNLGSPHIRMFVAYEIGQENVPLEHSYGLRKGLVGVVHAFALDAQTQQNNIVIAHELLHTLGASDKYNHQGLPNFPDGYADSKQEPLHPQHQAEIMAGRIALSPYKAAIPASLLDCSIGALTAYEINWRWR